MESKWSRYIDKIVAEAGPSARPYFEKFVMRLRTQNIKARSIYNYLSVLRRWLRWTKKRGLTVEDWGAELAYEWVSFLENPHSRTHYLLSIYRFFKEIEHPDVEVLKVPKRPRAKLPDVLSEEQVLSLAEHCDHIRDRALILVTYESTRRNHEVRGVRVRDVKFDEYGALVTFHSTKSENATIRLVLSAKALQGWMELHGDRENPDAHVFYGRQGTLSAERFREIVKTAAGKAGIRCRVYPHLLRHSRIAVLKRKNVLTDADIMNITGHRDRRQLDRYGRITMTMTNEKLLEVQGLQAREEEKRVEVKKCRRCGFVNGPLSQYCGRCTLPLSEETVWRRDKLLADVELLTHLPGGEELFRDIVERAKARLNDLVREKKEREVSSA